MVNVNFHSGKTRSDIQQMKSEIGNISETLDTLKMAQRETEDEGQLWIKLNEGYVQYNGNNIKAHFKSLTYSISAAF